MGDRTVSDTILDKGPNATVPRAGDKQGHAGSSDHLRDTVQPLDEYERLAGLLDIIANRVGIMIVRLDRAIDEPEVVERIVGPLGHA